MPVTITYPGVYIEELPSLIHSVTPAPTSVTVFIGYTHPFETKNFNTATGFSASPTTRPVSVASSVSARGRTAASPAHFCPTMSATLSTSSSRTADPTPGSSVCRRAASWTAMALMYRQTVRLPLNGSNPITLSARDDDAQHFRRGGSCGGRRGGFCGGRLWPCPSRGPCRPDIRPANPGRPECRSRWLRTNWLGLTVIAGRCSP